MNFTKAFNEPITFLENYILYINQYFLRKRYFSFQRQDYIGISWLKLHSVKCSNLVKNQLSDIYNNLRLCVQCDVLKRNNLTNFSKYVFSYFVILQPNFKLTATGILFEYLHNKNVFLILFLY